MYNNDEDQVFDEKELEELTKLEYSPFKDEEEVQEEKELYLAQPVVGVVSCAKLNIRSKPSLDSQILKVVSKGETFDLDSDFVHEDFYKLESEEAYLFKKFVLLES